MKKVTVITLQNVRNYGSVLQALATQKLFNDLGCDVDFINYTRKNFKTKKVRIKNYYKGKGLVARIIFPFILYPTFLRQDYIFKKFINLNLNVQKKEVTTREDFSKLPLLSDIYCTGSDQTWNSEWNGGLLPELFLDFVPDDIPKIAYAASMGKEALGDWEKEETKKLLLRYNAISVRESSAVSIINNLGINNAIQVLDPTLQMSREFWMSQAPPKKEEPYILIYQLNTNKQFDEYAKEFARRKGLKLIRFCTRFDQLFKCGKSLLIPKVEDFISYIANAEYVITDSFHATAFSINLNTNFISVYPQEFGGRISSILELTGLKERHLANYNDYSFIDKPKIDFTYANEVLCNERKKAVNFLKQALTNI